MSPRTDADASTRLRGRPSTGDRTTLRVPRRLDDAIERLRGERALTRNEALIALADRGAEALEAERRVGAAREALERAVLAPVQAGGLPSPQEVERAMLEARGERS